MLSWITCCNIATLSVFQDLIDTVFQGYNCSVFAYGATGAGKTFTMLGSQVGSFFLRQFKN